MTSELNELENSAVNEDENKDVSVPTKKRSFAAVVWKVTKGFAFLFFLLGFLTTTSVAYKFYSHYSDKQYEQNGDNWEHNGSGTGEVADLKIITYKSSDITDSKLDSLADRPDVAAVYLVNCPNITDACVESLSRIPNLRRLVIERCDQIKTPDFSKLAQLKKLTRLSVSYCYNLTDESAKKIARLRSLKILHMTGCSNLTPQSVSRLRKLPLTEFAPPECVLTDETICEVVKFKRLRYLYIGGKKYETLPLTDEGLVSLSAIGGKKYETLPLTGTGIALLSKMKKLRGLRVEDCPNVSTDALAELANKVNAHRGMWSYELLVSSDHDVGKESIPSGFKYDDVHTR